MTSHFERLCNADKRVRYSFILLPLILLLLTDLPARAATITVCQDGAKVTVDGVIHTVYANKDGTRFYIKETNFDCGKISITVKKPGNCKLGSKIHATGVLMQQGIAADEGWRLGDQNAPKAIAYGSSFSCK